MKEQRRIFKWSLQRGKALLIPAARSWAKWEINKISPRVHCTDDNFVSFFLPPKLLLTSPSFYDSIKFEVAWWCTSGYSFSQSL